MSGVYTFDRARGLIIVPTYIHGPNGDTVARLALDTGATWTVVRTAVLVSIGCDPAASLERVELTTGSGVEYPSRLSVQKLEALGQERTQFNVIVHTFPPSAKVDGVLGLDFLRDHRLIIDFRKGEITLE